jgi:hypothetical protein
MSSTEISATEDLVRLARLASEARGVHALVCAQHELRTALRRILASRQWSQLDEAQRAMTGWPSVAARFCENLHGVLETPELGAHERDERWHGLVLAIPVTLTARSGTLLALPASLAGTLRDSLQERFPPDTGIRLVNRPVPQLVAHTMGAQAFYELVEELASGERGVPAVAGSQPQTAFVAHGRSLGQHYFFALALTTRPEQLGLELPGDLQTEPRLVKWAADQTERITSDFAERGWPLLMRVYPPRRLRDMLASPPMLGDVRELDGLLEHAAVRLGAGVTALRVDLALARGAEPCLRITVGGRTPGTPLVQALYRLAALGAEAGTYRVAVRLASAGVEVAATDENLRGAVQRAITLTNAPAPSDPAVTPEPAMPHPLGLKTLRSRFARSPRHSS